MYTWTAIYKDNSELKQFVDGRESLFKDIKQEDLLAFRIDDDTRHIIVDLKIGVFLVNNTIFEIPDLSFKEAEYRLIYFRRVSNSIGTVPGIGGHSVSSFIGFQTKINGKNKKAIFSVDERHIIKTY